MKRYAWNNFIGSPILVAKFCLKTNKKFKIFHSGQVWGLTSLSRSKSLHLNQIHMHDRCRTLYHRSTCKNVHFHSPLECSSPKKRCQIADLSHLKEDKNIQAFLWSPLLVQAGLYHRRRVWPSELILYTCASSGDKHGRSWTLVSKLQESKHRALSASYI